MTSHKTIAIIVPNLTERRALSSLLIEEGFLVKAYGSTGEFVCSIDLPKCGCLIVDSDLPRESLSKPSAAHFATRWNHQLPVILLTSESSTLHLDLPIPAVSKSAGENDLLYAIYGALDQAANLVS